MATRIISPHWNADGSREKFLTGFSHRLSAVIINETAAKLLGFKKPLNETLYRPGDYASDGKS
jgi:hypothetical protein